MKPDKKKAIKRYEYQRAYAKLYNRAKTRAWARLEKAHPEEFAQIFKEEREFVELEQEEEEILKKLIKE